MRIFIHLCLLLFGLAACIENKPVSSNIAKTNFVPQLFFEDLDTAKHIANYELLKAKIKEERYQFQDQEKANDYFFKMLNDSIFNYWMGTTWDFNGHTSTPRKGEIACGYFVTTTLQDMGVHLQRYKLAQQSATAIVEQLCAASSKQRFTSLDSFNNYLSNRGQEIYVLGLDYHVGFVVRENGTSYFVHSDYIGSSGVTRELLNESQAIRDSNLYVVGSVTGNRDLLQKWRTN